MDGRNNTKEEYPEHTDKRHSLNIHSAVYITEYKILFTFCDGLHGVIDFRPLIDKLEVRKPFLNKDLFIKFKIANGGIHFYWPGNIMDYHFEYLRSLLLK